MKYSRRRCCRSVFVIISRLTPITIERARQFCSAFDSIIESIVQSGFHELRSAEFVNLARVALASENVCRYTDNHSSHSSHSTLHFSTPFNIFEHDSVLRINRLRTFAVLSGNTFWCGVCVRVSARGLASRLQCFVTIRQHSNR